MITSVIIPAAGKSTRMGTNKLLLNIGSTPVLIRTMSVFYYMKEIDHIILVASTENINVYKETIKKYKMTDKITVAKGGNTRTQSVYNGLKEVPADSDVVLVHDAARPLVSIKTIQSCIEASRKHSVCCAGVKVKDTIKQVNDNTIYNTLDRNRLYAAQTPQGFIYEVIKKAYDNVDLNDTTATDDTVLAERIGYKVKVVESDYSNIKITTKEDIIIANALLDYRNNT